jgi:O-antigen ligase
MMDKESFNSWEKRIDTVFFFSLVLMVFFLPLYIRYANLSVALASFCWLLNSRRNIKYRTPSILIPIGLFTAVYLLHLVGMLYTDNTRAGWLLVEKKLPILALPIVFLASPLTKKHIDILLYTFIAGVTVTCLYCYVVNLQLMTAEDLPIRSFIDDSRFQNNDFSKVIPIHPAYLSTFIVFCVVILLYRYRNYPLFFKIIVPFLIAFFLITILILMARGGLFAMIAVAIVLTLKESINRKKISIFVTSTAFILLALLAIIKFVPNLKTRLLDTFGSFSEMATNDDQLNSVATHIKSWRCATESVTDYHLFFGHGTGDEKDVLRACYAANGWEDMARVAYDAHNEFLSALVRHGLFGLLVWVAGLAYASYWALRRQDYIYFTFLILAVVAALSESILRGQISLLFYAFFNSCLFKRMLIEAGTSANSAGPDKYQGIAEQHPAALQ